MDSDIGRFILSIPPVTLFLLSSTLFISIAPLLGIARASQLVNIWPYTLKGQLWRLFTGFFYVGGGLNLVISLFSLYRFSYGIETAYFIGNIPEYSFFLVFNAGIILFLSYFISSISYFTALNLSICYFWSQRNLNTITNLWFFRIKGRYLPFSMLLLSFFMGGLFSVMQDACGLLSAHLYEFLTNILPSSGGPRLTVPRWFINLFPLETPRIIRRPFGVLFNNQRNVQNLPPMKSAFKGKGHKLY
ncbi:hypothetical protein PNEG_01002 [Pneumocystis murina B123]|uniref:Derlin n=1 Tax=Pneumocystis murina (strain B123) TaxID=1069680 RepID=M7NUS8_PNEMU|nr:hypothetical protein PNEG_01002 [Pneumocystis murina B123]EMR10856.1 hypothetical protein PNEG_01002 [Pneumocystis murina B123]